MGALHWTQHGVVCHDMKIGICLLWHISWIQLQYFLAILSSISVVEGSFAFLSCINYIVEMLILNAECGAVFANIWLLLLELFLLFCFRRSKSILRLMIQLFWTLCINYRALYALTFLYSLKEINNLPGDFFVHFVFLIKYSKLSWWLHCGSQGNG